MLLMVPGIWFLVPWIFFSPGVFVSLSALPPVDSVSHTASFEASSLCSLLEPCHAVRCWGEEVICDVTCYHSGQSFVGLVLLLWPFLSPFRLEGTGQGLPTSQIRLRCSCFPGSTGLWCRTFWEYLKMAIFPSHCLQHERIFWDLHPENLMGFLDTKAIELWGFP